MELQLIGEKEAEQPKEKINTEKFIVDNECINDEVEKFLDGKIPKGFRTGFGVIDNNFVCKQNEFYIVTGKKGQGKTTIEQTKQVMHSIANDLVWVVAFQENSNWSMKLCYLGYLLGENPNEVRKNNKELYLKALEWVDAHFIFLEVESVKEALDTTVDLIAKGVNVHATLIDPINSFTSGYSDSGNKHADGVVTATKILKHTQNYASVYISQHPTMFGQRKEGRVTSYEAEGGWFLNKASFTYVIHREKGTNKNELHIENVRNKHTGGEETSEDNPVIIHWHPYKIDISKGGTTVTDIIGRLKQTHNPLNEVFKDEHKIVNIEPIDAFDLTEEENNSVPF